MAVAGRAVHSREEPDLLRGCQSVLSVTLAAMEREREGANELSQQDHRGTI